MKGSSSKKLALSAAQACRLLTPSLCLGGTSILPSPARRVQGTFLPPRLTSRVIRVTLFFLLSSPALLSGICSASPLLPFQPLSPLFLSSLPPVGSSLTSPHFSSLLCIPLPCGLSLLPHGPPLLLVFLFSSPFSFLLSFAFLSPFLLV